MIQVVEITTAPADLELRIEDEVECEMGGLTAQEAVQLSIDRSAVALALTVDGQPAAFFGHAPTSILGEVCWAWMLTTPLADTIPLVLAAASRRIVDTWHSAYPTILIRVDPTYTKAVRWLRWLGFVPDSVVGPFLQMRADRKGMN